MYGRSWDYVILSHSCLQAEGFTLNSDRQWISDTERFMGYHTETHNDDGAQVTQNLSAGGKYTRSLQTCWRPITST